MLLLVTLALVVASAVLLILGFVQDTLGFIYVSMLCAGVAALALFVFARLARRRGAVLAGAGIASSPYGAGAQGGRETVPAVRSADEGVARPRGRATLATPARPDPDDDYDEERAEDDTAQIGVVGAGSAFSTDGETDGWVAGEDAEDDWGDEVVFPIEDYDDLRVAEILPLLSQLDPDELQEVRDREVAGKARASILDRIDDRLGRSEDAPATVSGPVVEPISSGEPSAPGAPAFAAPPRKAAASRAAGGAAKKTAAAQKTAARKTAAQKTTAKKTPAKKAAPRKPAAPPQPTATNEEIAAVTDPGVTAPAVADHGAATDAGLGADDGLGAADQSPLVAGDPSAPPTGAPVPGRKVAAAEATPPSTTARRTAAAKTTGRTTRKSAATGTARSAAGQAAAAKKAAGPAKRAAKKPESDSEPEAGAE